MYALSNGKTGNNRRPHVAKLENPRCEYNIIF
jgi:hypothetical protein